MGIVVNTNPQKAGGSIHEGIRFVPLWKYECFGAIDVKDPEEFLALVGDKTPFYPTAFNLIRNGKIYQSDVDKLIRTGQIRNVEHLLSGGGMKWQDRNGNIITTAGKNDILDQYFDQGTGPALYVGLIDDTAAFTPNAASTIASLGGGGGALEFTSYTGNRQQFYAAAASGGAIANSGTAGADPGPAQFPITGADTLQGGFLCTAATGTSGILVSENDFSGGDRAVVNTDTLNVTITYTLT